MVSLHRALADIQNALDEGQDTQAIKAFAALYGAAVSPPRVWLLGYYQGAFKGTTKAWHLRLFQYPGYKAAMKLIVYSQYLPVNHPSWKYRGDPTKEERRKRNAKAIGIA